MKKPIYLIVAMDLKRGMGKNGHLPWHLKGDMKFFRDTTMKTNDPKKQNMVIMGRKTWESIPAKFRPLPKRKNVIMTHNRQYQVQGATVCDSLNAAIKMENDEIESVFIIGGKTVFEETFNSQIIDGIYLTKIHKTFDCDTFFSALPRHYKRKKLREEEEKGIKLSYYKIALSHTASRNS